MGGIVSITLNVPCDNIANARCWDPLIPDETYVPKLKENLRDLQTALEELKALKNDVETRVKVEEQKQFIKRLDQVRLWMEQVEAAEIQVDDVVSQSNQEVAKLRCGGYCSKNYKSSYEYGKNVVEKLSEVKTLKSKGDFTEVTSECLPAILVNEISVEPTVGMESMFKEVWSQLEDEEVGVIGLYGMGGVGKTTLLKQINNNFLVQNLKYDIDIVIFVVVSKDLDHEIQDKIGETIGIFNETWKKKEPQAKAIDIGQFLRDRKFVLLLDDVRRRIEITALGIPAPSKLNKSKIVFTARTEQVCGLMDAKKKIKVDCLLPGPALQLFLDKVGDIHPEIREHAETMATECCGLPLVLITVGRVMACKTTPEEWNYEIEVLKKSAAKFKGMAKEVFPLLKFSYDNLPNEKVKSCFLYCALFPEAYPIHKDDLLYLWMCEEILDEFGNIDKARDECYSITGDLIAACLLESKGHHHVQMHDVIREMALWIASDCEAKDSILVHTSDNGAPDVKRWENTKRVSLVYSHIEQLVEPPNSPNLLTLLIRGSDLKTVSRDFFDFITTLKVLDLSENSLLTQLPSGVSKLVSLQQLNLSRTGIRELPIELNALVSLICLNLEHMRQLNSVPPNIISNLQKLKVLRLLECGTSDEILFHGQRSVIEELKGLEHLYMLTLSVKSTDCFKILFRYELLVKCTRTLFLSDSKGHSNSIDITSLANMKHLDTLQIHVWHSPYLEQLETCWAGPSPNPMMANQSCFGNLKYVEVVECQNLKDLTWLIFAPNLSQLQVNKCSGMEKIIDLERLGAVKNVVNALNPFARLTVLSLSSLKLLKSIYDSALPFEYLNEINVLGCPELKKLPFNSTRSQRSNFIIRGEEYWWNGLKWEDDDTRNVFLPCFRPPS